MRTQYVVALKKQRDQLNELISVLKQKERFTEFDLNFYDTTTKQIERGLRTLRRLISEEVSKKFETVQPHH